jgi:hypothetical protein
MLDGGDRLVEVQAALAIATLEEHLASRDPPTLGESLRRRRSE